MCSNILSFSYINLFLYLNLNYFLSQKNEGLNHVLKLLDITKFCRV